MSEGEEWVTIAETTQQMAYTHARLLRQRYEGKRLPDVYLLRPNKLVRSDSEFM